MKKIDEIKTNPEGWEEEIRNVETSTLYAKTLDLQMQITESEVLRFVVNDPLWESASRVLDIGCGPGHLIELLSRYFPKKNYRGVDISEDFVKSAKKRTFNSSVKFDVADVYKLSPQEKYDYIHVRAVLQHLPDIPKFIDVLANITRPGSCVLFLDSVSSAVVNPGFIPDLPSYKIFFERLAKAQKEKGGSRDCLTELEVMLGQYPFRVTYSQDFLIPSSGESTRETYFFYIYFVCELLDRMYSVNSDRQSILRELFNWYNAPARYAQFHAKWVKLERTNE